MDDEYGTVEVELPFGEYDKRENTGLGEVLTFKLKKEQIAVLNELVTHMPKMNRSDCVRAMILPWLDALLLAKEGKRWQAAMEFGKDFVKMTKQVEKIHEDATQGDFSGELFKQDTVTEVPNSV